MFLLVDSLFNVLFNFLLFFIYQNPKSLCFSHSLQNSFIHAYLLSLPQNCSAKSCEASEVRAKTKVKVK